jgi:Rhodopirellula transposase DDE domain
MLKFIRTNQTKTGFRRLAQFDRRKYLSKQRVTPEEKANLNLPVNRLFPEWNYTIRPHAK